MKWNLISRVCCNVKHNLTNSNLHMDYFKSIERPLVLLFLLCLFPLGISAQSIIRGTVSDESGEPIIGATIRVDGKPGGAVSDFDGHFSVTAASNAKLTISFVGYETKTVEIAGRNNITVNLREDEHSLSDIVVIGYGTAKRSDISGSVTSVNTADMLKRAPINLAQGLQGTAPGVLVTGQDGAPNAMAQVRIRGVGTINNNAEPLYVVDGVIVGNNANFLNPQDVEAIEVLKDASATAIYGSRGANGVIMVTTKHGTKGKVRVEASATFGIQTLASTLDVMDADGYAKAIRMARASDNKNVALHQFDEQWDGQRKTIDWQKEMTRTAIRQNYALSASGGTDKMQANFSAGYLDNQGMVVNTQYRRINLRANASMQVNKFLNVGGDLNFAHDANYGSNVGFGNDVNLSSIRDYATMCPTMDYVQDGKLVSPNIVNPDGTYGTFQQFAVSGAEVSGSTDSFYARQMELDNPTRGNRFLGNVYIDLNPFKGLHLKSIVSYNHSDTDAYSWAKTIRRYNLNPATGKYEGVKMQGLDLRQNFGLNKATTYDKTWETYLTYNWSNDIHDLTVMVGNSYQAGKSSWVNGSAKDFSADNIRVIGQTKDNSTKDTGGAFNLQSRFVSYYGRLMYNLMNRYSLTASIRRDGSSNFGSDHRWGTFPSMAASWRLSEEDFMKSLSWLSNAKIRFGWGRTGNAGNPTNLSVYQLGSAGCQYHFYSAGASTQDFSLANGMAQQKKGNPKLGWETNEQTNIGLDFSVLKGDLTVTLDYFIRDAKDLLNNLSLRPSSGYPDYYCNTCEIQNKGLEMSIAYNHRVNNDFSFGVTFTGSTLKNEVIKCGDPVFNTCSGGNDGSNIDGSNVQGIDASGFNWTNHSVCKEGAAVGSFYGYRSLGIIREQSQIDELNKYYNEHKSADDDQGVYQKGLQVGDIYYADLDGDGKVSASDMDVIGDGFPKFNYGLNLSAKYKNFDFSLYAYGVFGQKILSYSAMRLSCMKQGDDPSASNILKESFNESFSNNPNGSLPRLSLLDGDNCNSRVSDFWIKNGDFLKISNLQIGYTFPKAWLSALKMEGARAYFSISNLCCISGYNKYGDPECGQGNVVYTGLDTGRYPTPRTYTFGLNVQF